MNKEQIVKEVLKRMDEINPLDAINVLPNPVVEGLLDESAKNILRSAPSYLLPLTDFSSLPGVGIPSTEVIIQQQKLPATFLRLIRFRLSDWIRPCTMAVQEGSPLHNLQHHKYTFGGTSRPVVALVNGAMGKSIEYYTALATSPTISEAYCVVEIPVESFPNDLLEALYWYTAAVAFQVFEMGEPMKACMNKVEEQYKLLSNGN